MAKKYLWKDIENTDIDVLISNEAIRLTNCLEAIAEGVDGLDGSGLIFVCGPSASGKTTFSERLNDTLIVRGHRCHIISLDDFFLNREDIPYIGDGLRDFDSIDSLDTDKVLECLSSLINKGRAEIPNFDFISGKRLNTSRTIKLNEGDMVIVEGIHAFNPMISNNLDKKKYLNVYIEPMSEIIINDKLTADSRRLRLMRRMIRDKHLRGSNEEATLRQWTYVIESELINIYPYVMLADYLVDSTTEYELMIYKDMLYPYIKGSVFQDLIYILKDITPLSPDIVPKNSLLREFTYFK